MSAGDRSPGARVYALPGNPFPLAPGQFGRHPADGNWYACTPTGLLANLRAHDVTEHDDGSVTVHASSMITTHPSILVTQPTPDGELRWHGYLESGIWREV